MYQIRRAEPEDAPAIIRVARTVWHATYEGILPRAVQDRALDEWYQVERLRQQAANRRSAFFVAVDQTGSLVGFAHLSRRPQPGDVELNRFYVLPEHQGRGIGRQLIDAASAALRDEAPVTRLFAQVEKENRIGSQAYRALGFDLVGEYTEELFGHKTDMVEFCLTTKE